MGSLSIWHWVIILAVLILLFGAKKLPDAARGVGRSLRILKSEVGAMNEDSKEKKDAEAAAAAAAAAQAAAATPVITPASAVQPIPAPEPIHPSPVSGDQR